MAELVARYGLIAVFLGAALEGDASVLAGGALYHAGHLPFWPLVLAALLGGWASDLAVFSLARRNANSRWVRGATEALHRNRFLKALINRPIILALAFRFLPGARTIGPVALAGRHDLTFPRYLALTAIAAAGWALVLVTFGQQIGALAELIWGELKLHHHLLLWLPIVALSAAGGLLLRKRWKQPPAAR